jgi:hypothetical protein
MSLMSLRMRVPLSAGGQGWLAAPACLAGPTSRGIRRQVSDFEQESIFILHKPRYATADGPIFSMVPSVILTY